MIIEVNIVGRRITGRRCIFSIIMGQWFSEETKSDIGEGPHITSTYHYSSKRNPILEFQSSVNDVNILELWQSHIVVMNED